MDLLGAIFIVVVAILIVTSVSLGMFLSRVRIGQTETTRSQSETTDGNSNKLDRIEKSIREGTCVGILAISVAAIVAAGTINVDFGWKLVLYIVGGLGIIYSIVRYYFRRV